MAATLQKRTERLLGAVEAAGTEAQAAEALHALLAATRAAPITFAHRTRAEAVGGRLARRGLLGAEHPLMKLLALRVSTHYLPGVSEFPLPPPPQQPPQPPSSSSDDRAVDDAAAAAAALAPIPRSPTTAGGGDISNKAWLFVFQPLPRGAQLLCTVTRVSSRSRLRPPLYRLHVERLCLAGGGGDEDAGRQWRQALQAAGLDPRLVVVAGGGVEEEAVASGGGGGGAQREERRRCLLEARRLKASPVVKAAQQLVVYGFVPASSAVSTAAESAEREKKGGNGKGTGTRKKGGRGSGKKGEEGEEGEERVAVALGRLQSPAPGVLTAAATAPADSAAHGTGPPPSPIGARLCVQVSERERLLGLSAVLPAEGGRGNVYTSARGVPEVLEAPLAHLQAALAQPLPPSAFFGARTRPPRWSPLDRLYTLDFERGAQRVREPSRKNLALMDVSHLPASALVAPWPPAGGRGASGGAGGGGGGVMGRGLSRGGSGVGPVAAAAAAATQEVGWAREGKGPRPVLQMGKMGDRRFSLDFRAPFSPFQALAVAIAAFEA